MGILDGECKIDENVQVVVSKKIFKEAIEEHVSMIQEDLIRMIGLQEEQIKNLTFEIDRLKTLTYELSSHLKEYQLDVFDDNLRGKIFLLPKDVDIDPLNF